VTFTATPSAGQGHTYSWSSDSSVLNSYLSANGNTCTVSIPQELSAAFNATVTCTVTSDGDVTNSGSASFTYNTLPVPVINAISPSTASIVGTGSAVYTATASGDGLMYSWTSSDATLNSYLSGTTGATLSVNIPVELSDSLSATLTCTVMNSYGKSAQKSVSFSYSPAPIPVISAITPASATITGTGSTTFTATASGEGLSYEWSSSNSGLDAYLSGTNTATLTVNIPAELASSFVSTLTCTVTNSYGKNAAAEATLSYEALSAPVIDSVSPAVVSIVGTGIATFTANATGTDISYKWTSSDASLEAYMSDTDTDTLMINISEELDSAVTATITCTVTAGNGKSVSKTARLSYKPTPVPTIESITPESAAVDETGSVTYTAVVSGDGLSYSWTSSDPALNAYMSGTGTNTLTVNIPTALSDDISAVFTLTVTNTYGKTAVSTVSFKYTAPFDDGFDVVMVGDLDGDGSISAKDVNLIRRVVSGIMIASTKQLAAGDLNGDGMLNGFDANLLTRRAAGM